MVRFTFVIGGGKNVRGKYSPELAKWMRAALSDIGFADDRGAPQGQHPCSQGAAL